jgi:hypothetical protein
LILNLLGNAIRTHLFNVGLAAPFKKTISMHGLRTASANEIADNGGDMLDMRATTRESAPVRCSGSGTKRLRIRPRTASRRGALKSKSPNSRGDQISKLKDGDAAKASSLLSSKCPDW